MNTPTGSASFQKRNPHLFGGLKEFMDRGLAAQKAVDTLAKPPKRIRQSTKPVMNKLEEAFLNHLWLFRADGCTSKIYAQDITFRLANGLRYTPDIFTFDWPALGELNRPTAWEVKGKWVDGDSFPKLKMFAHTYPEIRVILAWKDKNGQWQTQRILA